MPSRVTSTVSPGVTATNVFGAPLMITSPGPKGIQTNALAPGYFATELTKALVENEEFTQWVTSRTPAGRWGNVEDLVGGLVYLASPASNFVNGQVLYVDGGMTAVV